MNVRISRKQRQFGTRGCLYNEHADGVEENTKQRWWQTAWQAGTDPANQKTRGEARAVSITVNALCLPPSRPSSRIPGMSSFFSHCLLWHLHPPLLFCLGIQSSPSLDVVNRDSSVIPYWRIVENSLIKSDFAAGHEIGFHKYTSQVCLFLACLKKKKVGSML